MDAPYQAAPDVHVLPTNLPMPGVGRAARSTPTCCWPRSRCSSTPGSAWTATTSSTPWRRSSTRTALRWVWLTHDDADHTGSIQRVLEAAPQARLVTHAFSAMRMATWWPVPLDRVHAIRAGDRLAGRRPHAAGRAAAAVRQPDVDRAARRGDRLASSRSTPSAPSCPRRPRTRPRCRTTPWPAACWRGPRPTRRGPTSSTASGSARCSTACAACSRPASSPRTCPAANGTSLERFLQVLESVPDAEPAVAPNHEEFGYMLAAMTAPQGEPQLAAAQ